MKQEIAIFWFRRDLRLDDNTGLYRALQSPYPVLPLFIFDENILEKLPEDDARVSFIYDSLEKIHLKLKQLGSSLLVKKGNPKNIWENLLEEYDVKSVSLNKDYEPYAIMRDLEIKQLLQSKGITLNAFKDQVIFEETEISKADGSPYTVYTPYKNKWLEKYSSLAPVSEFDTELLFSNFCINSSTFPSLHEIGFVRSHIEVRPYDLSHISNYHEIRDYPAVDGTSYLSPHLRFGTLSIRKLVNWAYKKNTVFLSELIWREFFMQILLSFPNCVTQNFKSAYDGIQWRNNKEEFEKWCSGNTGYPLVDAGMRQLNQSGYMHNRVRMVAASFLCKHLLIDWRWGEAYFAQKLLDFELASNVGNWQWAAGTGCDAAPYFRVFNPDLQLKKFDTKGQYIRKWIPEFDLGYSSPIVEHSFARERAIEAYRKGILK